MIVWVAGYGPSERARRVGPHSPKRGAQRDTLPIVSGCAPRRQVHCGEKLSGRNQRRGSAPGQIEFEGTAMAAAHLLAEPGALRLPGFTEGERKAKKKKNNTSDSIVLF